MPSTSRVEPAALTADGLVPERFVLAASWRLTAPVMELWLDQHHNDGLLLARAGRGAERTMPVFAVVNHAAGVLGPLVWQEPAQEWDDDRKALAKARIVAVLSGEPGALEGE